MTQDPTAHVGPYRRLTQAQLDGAQKCGHRHEVVLTYNGYKDELVVYKTCESCAAMVWDRLAHPHRDSFVIEEIEVQP